MNAELDLAEILRRVADGELSVEDAEPLVEAAQADGDGPPPARTQRPERAARGPAPERPTRTVHIEVTERGRKVVDLRMPASLTSLAGAGVPGLGSGHVERLREALRNGLIGPVLEVEDEHGDGVRISTE